MVLVALVGPWVLGVGLIIVAVMHDGELKELSNRVRTLEVIERATWRSERD